MNKQLLYLFESKDWLIDEDYAMKMANNLLFELAVGKASVPTIKNQREVLDTVTFYTPDYVEVDSCQAADLRDKVSDGTIDLNTVAEINLSGVMQMNDGLSHTGMQRFAENLKALDGNVSGIKLNINSGGGEAIAGFHLANTISDMKTPIVAFLHYAASAAYMAAAVSDYAVAAGAHVSVGSIGTYGQLNKEVLTYIKENYETIYPDNSPDKNMEMREFEKGNSEPMKERLSKITDAFVELVDNNRLISEEKVYKGGVFDAKTALTYGLIDEIGTDAFALNILFN